jgi:hypothetical protein
MKRVLVFLTVVCIFFISSVVFGEKLPEGSMDYYSPKEIKQYTLIEMNLSRVIPWAMTAVFVKHEIIGDLTEDLTKIPEETEIPEEDETPEHFQERLEKFQKKIILAERLILVLDVRDNDNYRIIAICHQKREKQDQEVVTIGCHADLDYLNTLGQNDPQWKTFDSHCQEEIDNNFLRPLEKIYKETAEKTGKR